MGKPREMAAVIEQPVNRINGVHSRQDAKGAVAPTHGQEYLKRARRRRLDLKTLHGTLRESARVYRELAEAKITLLEAETRSRVLRRHSEILTALEQRDQIEALQRQLEALQGRSPALTLDADGALETGRGTLTNGHAVGDLADPDQVPE
jgi:hypothetical protein